jgi:hypothetical protein
MIFGLVGTIIGIQQDDSDEDTPIPKLTAKAVVDAAYAGCTDHDIARRHLVTEEHIRERYAADLEIARGNRAYVLRKAQFVTALKGNGPLLTWLGRNELGQSLSPQQPLEAEPVLDAKVG